MAYVADSSRLLSKEPHGGCMKLDVTRRGWECIVERA